jgi:hypothetical protein
MQQDDKVHWVYEWPMKKKVKWSVKRFLGRGQQQLLNRWLRYVESLRDEVIVIYEPEIGRHLSDEEEVRSDEDLINCQVGRNELSSCQVGNGKRLVEGILYYQGISVEGSIF